MDWFLMLSEEDKKFIQRFVLSSGSLKELASIYGVSYPTVRLRLNNVINKINVNSEMTKASFESKLMEMVIDKKLEFNLAQEIITKYRESDSD